MDELIPSLAKLLDTLAPAFRKEVFPTFCGSSHFRVGEFSQFRQHAGEDFQAQVFLIAEAVRASLDGAELVVESFHESERHLILFVAVGLDAVPMRSDHVGKAFVGSETLPAERITPVLEKASRPGRLLVLPKLIERLLQQVGLEEPPIGVKQ